MTDPVPSPSPPTRRWGRWLFALVLVATAVLLLLPVSPLYIVDLLRPPLMYDGKRASYWIRQLDSHDPEARAKAVFAVGAMGPDAAKAVPALGAILANDSDAELRREAAMALSKMAPASRAAVSALASALSDDSHQVRMYAAIALLRLAEAARPAAPSLIKAIADDSNDTNLGSFHSTIQEVAAVALGRATAGTKEGVAALIDALHEEASDELRAAAARGLGAIGPEANSAVPRLQRLLEDNSPHVRESAEAALWDLGEKPARGKPSSPATDPHLPEVERAYLWKIENRGNELVKYGFGPLAKALKAADRKALLSILAKDFKGAELSVTRRLAVQAPFATLTREGAGGPAPGTLNRAQFIDRLLKLRGTYASSPPGVQFSLKTLSPVQRGQLDGAWEGTALLRLHGEQRPGAPAEVLATVRYRIPKLTREALGRPGWLNGADLGGVTTASAPRYLFVETAEKRGLSPGRLHDNWKAEKFSPMTGGVYVTDFNRDGLLDVLITDVNGCFLYQGQTSGQFKNVTTAVGLPAASVQVYAAAWIDIDGDGWEDLVLGGRVYRNEEGKRFVDYTRRSNLQVPSDANGLLVGDFDRDGKLDLYATRSSPPGSRSWLDAHGGDRRGNVLWRNKGGWQFDNVTRASGASGGRRSTFTAAWLDANNDGWPDLHVVNEFGDGQLLINNKNGTFSPRALADRPADFGSMGLAVGDVDNDGNIDLYCANMFSKAGTRVIGNLKPDAYPADVMEKLRRFVAGSQLHLNKGGGKFEQVGERMQVAAVGWAYGACLADLDNDGWLDIYATAGYISRSRTEPDG